MAEEEEEAEVVQASSDANTTEATPVEKDIESQIKAAMLSRVDYFKQQADSFTFEGVRRLLEKDLGLETYSLDKHKRLVKQCLLQGLDSADDETKTSGETVEKELSATGEAGGSPEKLNTKEDLKEPAAEGEKKINSEGEEETVKNEAAPSESTITEAMLKRASYIRANVAQVTMGEVRRILEEDLKLEKKTLDPYKKFISEKIDEILKSKKVSGSTTKLKNGSSTKKKQSKGTSSGEENSDASDNESEDMEEEEVKPKKRIAPKGKTHSEGVKKRQRLAKEPSAPRKRQKRVASDKDSDEEDDGNVSENGHAQSSDEKVVKRKEASTPAYGKRVEHLKSIIKSCGMSVPPSIYRRVKQAPESKREDRLIKELEEILSREGLSSNPSEKDIKQVRRKKERAKELEGIDMSNIVASPRRRSSTPFIAPLKPKTPVESNSEDDAEDTDNEDDEDDDDEDDEVDNDDNNDDDGNADSESEGLDEDEDSD